ADEKLEAFFEFLNSFYFDNEFDDEDSEAFDWVDFADSNHDVISFERKAKDKEYLVVMNFSDATFKRGIEVKEGLYKEVFSSSLSKFGGNERLSSKIKETKAKKGNAGKREITLNLNPLCAYVYEKTPCQK
ncbi:MAG: alpha amylase C-terminal domain-containing protein, partial [Lachnospiraceae bacterium]|nr:alpha amylase C-terminal domain-containing protein [Lachnospiraceae bacterium]